MTAATQISDSGDAIQVIAEIDDLDELFEAPDFDPFSEQPRATAVVDDIIAHLRSRHLRKPPAVSLTLLLPRGDELDDAVEVASSALARYAALKTAETLKEIEITRFEGRARLPWGIVVAIMAIVVVFLLNAFLPENLKPLLVALTPVVTVIIWVAIWNPAESLLYENWMLHRQKASYLVLGKTRVTVKPK